MHNKKLFKITFDNYIKYFFIFILLFLLFKIYKINKKNNFQIDMAQPVFFFEEKNFNNALYGNKIHKGFLRIINDYQFIVDLKVVYLYTGIIYIHLKKYKLAIKYLNNFKSNDFLLQSQAWSLIGDSFVKKKNYKEAIRYYKKSFNYRSNKFFTPIYIIKAALVYEQSNINNLAISCYNRILKDFSDSKYCNKAFKNKIRIQSILIK